MKPFKLYNYTTIQLFNYSFHMKCIHGTPLFLAFILSYHTYSHVGLTDNITQIARIATSQRISATQALKG